MKKIIALILIIILLVIFLISLLISSPAGLKLSIRVINSTTQTNIQYQTVSGTLLGPIKFTNLKACQPTACITSSDLSINWKLSDLLVKHLTINNITATDATLTLKKSTQTKKEEKSTKHSKKPAISVRNVDINQLIITLINQKTIQLKNIRLNTDNKASTTHVQAIANVTQPFALSTQLAITGSPDHYTIDALATNATTNIQLTGTGDQKKIHLTTTQGKIAKGTIDSDISAQWNPNWTWDSQTTINHMQPKLFNKNWPSKLNATIQSTGQLSKHHHQLSLNTQANTAHSKLSIAGNLGPTSDLVWSLNSNQLSELGNQVSGQLQSTGHITGNDQQPLISGTLTGSKLSDKQRSIQSLTSQFAINFDTTQPSSLTLTANRIKWGSSKLHTYHVTANGTLDHYALSTQASTQQGTINLALTGKQDEMHLDNEINTLSVQSNQFGNWSLTQPTSIQASTTLLQTNNLCFQESTSASNSACITIDYQQHKPWKTSITTKDVNIHTLTQTLLPANTSLSGDLSFSASIGGTKKTITDIDISADLNKGVLNTTQNNTSQQIPFSAATSNMSYHNQHVTGDLNLTENKQNFLQANISAKDMPSVVTLDPSQFISGSLKLQANNLTPYSAFFSTIDLSKGQLNADFSISGKLNTPHVTGQASLSHLTLTSPKIGLSFSDINVNINSNSGDTKYNGNITSGNSTLDITGSTHFTQPGWPSQLQVKGSNFLYSIPIPFKLTSTPISRFKQTTKPFLFQATLPSPQEKSLMSTPPTLSPYQPQTLSMHQTKKTKHHHGKLTLTHG